MRATADEEPELFWGLRGAGANFGIATSLEFELHPFSGTLHRGVHVHPATDIHEVWADLPRRSRLAAPETIAAIFTVALAEPAADYPDSVAGRPIIVISYNHSGAGEDVERDIAPLLKGPAPASVTATSEPYLTPSARATSRSPGARGPSSSAATSRTVRRRSWTRSSPTSSRCPGDGSISVTALGGAIGRVPDDATAFTGRAVPFDVSPDSAWSDAALDEANAAWVREAMAIVEPDLLPGRYINELSDAGPEVTAPSYGDAKLERLRALKRAWDPTNVFHLNHNVAPSSD